MLLAFCISATWIFINLPTRLSILHYCIDLDFPIGIYSQYWLGILISQSHINWVSKTSYIEKPSGEKTVFYKKFIKGWGVSKLIYNFFLATFGMFWGLPEHWPKPLGFLVLKFWTTPIGLVQSHPLLLHIPHFHHKDGGGPNCRYTCRYSIFCCLTRMGVDQIDRHACRYSIFCCLLGVIFVPLCIWENISLQTKSS